MTEFADPLVFWGMLLVQIIGLASVLLARLPHACLTQCYCRRLFVLCFVGLGLATLYAIGNQSGYWAWCGTTFTLMAVGGSSDLGSAVESSGF